jgi:hypothetical protein
MQTQFQEFNWEEAFEGKSTADSWTIFKETVHRVRDECIPERKPRPPKLLPPWWSSSLRRAVKRKEEIYQRYLHTRRTKEYREYTQQRNSTTSKIRAAQREYERKLIYDFKTNPKPFYGYMRGKQKVRAGVSQLEKEDKTLTEDSQEAANVLNSFFKSVFVNEDPGPLPEFDDVIGEEDSIKDVVFSVEDVRLKLEKLKVDKAQGPDEIHPRLLKECSRELASPLYCIFRKALDTGCIPQDWKIANVTPIFKKGKRSSAGNYRPVSLTSQVCKVMESIIRDHVLDHIDRNDIITDCQHGFMSGRSCLTNLLETLEEWTEAVDEGYPVDVVFLDYQKAFDTVPHRRLLHKLRGYGIRGKLLDWFRDYLEGRRQRVVVRGDCSEWGDVASGVPQGSVIGPLLFLLYVNELPNIVICGMKMFADDTKLYRTIREENDTVTLQGDLDKLSEWSRDWLLKFNAGKCKTMHIGSRNKDHTYSVLKENGDRIDLETTVEEKDVGVWITSDLKPSFQCAKAAKKAMSALGLVKRSFKHIDKSSFLRLYNCYVRPHLEYCVQAWAPYYKKDIKELEKVQRRATKLIPSLKNLPYEERLRNLGMYSLVCRRQRGDLIETFKLLTGVEKVPHEKFFQPAVVSSTRGHSQKLYRSQSKLMVRYNFFSQRVVSQWNQLPSQVVGAKSVSQFKDNLDQHWKKIRYGYSISQEA